MIKTREEYQEWRKAIEKFPNIRMWPDDMRNIVETIEALRDTVRANRAFFPDAKDEWDFVNPPPPEWFALQEALDTLPDWLTEND